MHAQETTFVDAPDEVEDDLEDGLEDEPDPLRAECDCCEEITASLLLVGTFLEVNGIVDVALMTNPDKARLMVSPSNT